MHAVVCVGGLLTDRSRQPLDYLVQEESEPVTATSVIGTFLLALWRTDVGGPLPQDVVRKQWTVAVFVTLSRLMSRSVRMPPTGRTRTVVMSYIARRFRVPVFGEQQQRG